MLLDILNIIGIIACAVTGALQAGRVKMDYFGVVVIAMVTGLGGGTIRDVMFQNYPLSWVGEPSYLYVACGFAILTIVVAPFMRYLKTVFLILDAMGMIAFSLLGAQVAMNLGYGVTLASVAGVCTGVFGGVIRDLLCNRIPIAFKHELYASISLATVFVYYFMIKLGLGYGFSVVTSVVFGFVFRVLAIRYNWSLPIFDYDDDKYLNVSFLENLPHKRIKRKVRILAIHYYRKKHPYRKKVQQANLTVTTEAPHEFDDSNVITAQHVDYDLHAVIENVQEQYIEQHTEQYTKQEVNSENAENSENSENEKNYISSESTVDYVNSISSDSVLDSKKSTSSDSVVDSKKYTSSESVVDFTNPISSESVINYENLVNSNNSKHLLSSDNLDNPKNDNSNVTNTNSSDQQFITDDYELNHSYLDCANSSYQTETTDNCNHDSNDLEDSNYPSYPNDQRAKPISINSTDQAELPPKQPADS